MAYSRMACASEWNSLSSQQLPRMPGPATAQSLTSLQIRSYQMSPDLFYDQQPISTAHQQGNPQVKMEEDLAITSPRTSSPPYEGRSNGDGYWTFEPGELRPGQGPDEMFDRITALQYSEPVMPTQQHHHTLPETLEPTLVLHQPEHASASVRTPYVDVSDLSRGGDEYREHTSFPGGSFTYQPAADREPCLFHGLDRLANIKSEDPDGPLSRPAGEDDDDNDSSGKPYAKLIYEALMEAPGHRMMLRDIYEWFTRNTSKPQHSGTNGWQNSIRHNLSMNKAFENDRSLASAKGSARKANSVWALTEHAVRHGVQSTTRYRKLTTGKRAVAGRAPAGHRQKSGAKAGRATRTGAARSEVTEPMCLSATTSPTLPSMGAGVIDEQVTVSSLDERRLARRSTEYEFEPTYTLSMLSHAFDEDQDLRYRNSGFLYDGDRNMDFAI